MKILKGLCIVVVVVLAAFGFGWVTMKLWNWLMPAIFGLTMITFWQAVGLLVLSKILFSGFGRGHHRHCGPGWGKHRGYHWRKRWEHKMANMTPEQREKFMHGARKCGWGEHPWEEWEKKETGTETKDVGPIPGEKL
jgi:hypothetical protein